VAKTKTYQPKSTATTATPARDDWTTQMLERASLAFSHDPKGRRKVVEDMKFGFIPGHQWDAHLTAKRKNRPCYESNRVRQLVRRVTGQQLQNKPQIKVRPVEDGDVETAEVINGLIKNIEVQSSADNAYDSSMLWSTGGGYGILRVDAEYDGPDTFNQSLRIVNEMDPMRWWCDPAAMEFDRSDAKFWFGDTFVTKDEFKRRWPKADMVNFDGPADRLERDWVRQDEVRIAQYWYVEPKLETIHLLSDGTVVKAAEFDPIADEVAAGLPDETGQPTAEPLTITASREVEIPCVYSCMVSGAGKLEEPKKWGGTMIPIVPQWGDLISLEGEQHYSGMIRFGRDMQTIHNFELSTAVEVTAKAPNSPLMATATQIKGLESYYERLGYDDPPVLMYNRDVHPTAGDAPPPMRQPMGQFPAALVQMGQVVSEELKAALGVYDASIGNRSNETSGRAILARKNEGETANYVYPDNQVKAIKRLGQILVDAIPHYYDTDRSIRILGEDMAEKFVRVNHVVTDQQTGERKMVHDLSRGKYDVTVTVGKSFDTARLELAEAAQALSQSQGPIGLLGQFMLLKSLDVPGMDEFVKAARKILVAQGLLEPAEGEPPPQPQPPNPKDVADAKSKEASAALNTAKAEGQQIDNAAAAAQLGAMGLSMGAPIGAPPMPNGMEQGLPLPDPNTPPLPGGMPF
jgi:hypothetical protein